MSEKYATDDELEYTGENPNKLVDGHGQGLDRITLTELRDMLTLLEEGKYEILSAEELVARMEANGTTDFSHE